MYYNLQCKVSLQQKQRFNYNVKIINPKKKSVYVTKSLPPNYQFHALNDFRKYVKEDIGHLQGPLGYVEPGHGAKGKLRELHDDEDLYEMYVLHKRKPDMLQWVYGDVDEQPAQDQDVMTIPRKRQRTDITSTKRESKNTNTKTLSTVEDIVQKLKDRHGANTHSVEQFNCWAHTINSGKWSSYEEPPDFPFFQEGQTR